MPKTLSASPQTRYLWPEKTRSSEATAGKKDFVRLRDLPRGEEVMIMAVEDADLEIALLQHGIREGDTCTITDIAPFGDPLAILVNGTKLALRKQDAGTIWVSRK